MAPHMIRLCNVFQLQQLAAVAGGVSAPVKKRKSSGTSEHEESQHTSVSSGAGSSTEMVVLEAPANRTSILALYGVHSSDNKASDDDEPDINFTQSAFEEKVEDIIEVLASQDVAMEVDNAGTSLQCISEPYFDEYHGNGKVEQRWFPAVVHP